MKENGCGHCGHCCIVCTDILLTKEEVAEGLYPKQRRHGSDDPNAWSKWIIMRGRIFENELNRKVFACIYWDPATRGCLIYEDRPLVCRMFDCSDKRFKRKGPQVHRIWKRMKEEKLESRCLDA